MKKKQIDSTDSLDKKTSQNKIFKKSISQSKLSDIEKEIDDIFNKKYECDHSIRIESLCIKCGIEIHHSPNFVVALHESDKIIQSSKEAFQLHLHKFYELYHNKKLILFLDLDQTLIHATLSKKPCNFSFKLHNIEFFIKKRPGLDKFLSKLSRFFEFHVYTMGTREYANYICKILDPNKIFFGDRIVTRTENNKMFKKYLERITNFSNNVIILDDRVDVWGFSPNVFLIKPFYYYDTNDINCTISKQIHTNNKLNNIAKQVNFQNNYTTKYFKKGKNDKELNFVYKKLRKIHKEYFRQLDSCIKSFNTTLKNLNITKITDVKEILKLNIFNNIKIICNPIYYNYVRFLGGEIIYPEQLSLLINYNNNIFIINDIQLAKKLNLQSINDIWLIKCIYRRKLINPLLFVQKS